MNDLHRYFQNPFSNKAISHAELQSFSEDHIGKLSSANGGGSYDALVTDTAAAYNAYFGELTHVALRTSVRMAATATMNLRWTAFVKYMTGKGEARIKDRSDKPSAIYTEFYPAGLSEYHSASQAAGQILAQRVKASATNHAAVLGDDFKTAVDDLVGAYEQARVTQVDHKGGQVNLRSDRDLAKAALQDQLFTNLLTLALSEKDPARVSFYFTQSLLEHPTSAPVPTSP